MRAGPDVLLRSKAKPNRHEAPQWTPRADVGHTRRQRPPHLDCVETLNASWTPAGPNAAAHVASSSTQATAARGAAWQPRRRVAAGKCADAPGTRVPRVVLRMIKGLVFCPCLFSNSVGVRRMRMGARSEGRQREPGLGKGAAVHAANGGRPWPGSSLTHSLEDTKRPDYTSWV